jgi:cysteinyl-tRNA synthetase
MNDDFNTHPNCSTIWRCTIRQSLKDNKETLNQEDLQFFKATMQGFVFDVLGLEDEKYQILRIIN